MEETKGSKNSNQFEAKTTLNTEKAVLTKLNYNSAPQSLAQDIANKQQIEYKNQQNQKRKRLLLNLFSDINNGQDQSDSTKTISLNLEKQQVIKLETKQNEKDVNRQPQKKQPINNSVPINQHFDQYKFDQQKFDQYKFHGLKNISKQKVLDHVFDGQSQRVNSLRQSNRDFFIVNRKFVQKQKQILIEGHTLYFPYEPYPAQISYMAQVLRSLDKSQNAVLQSPTGTGKTLCLLSSTLSWIQDNFRKTGNKTRLIYMSRTHSQLSQVQKELEKTCYRPNMSVFGSRQQLCIKGEFSILKGREKIQACGRAVKLTKKRLRQKKEKMSKQDKVQLACEFYRNKEDVLQISRRRLANQVLNIEKMKKIAQQEGFCPYFYPYDVKEEISLVLMPYNYLLDAYLLESYKSIIEGSIIVFDQAHNVAEAACEGQSLLLDSQTLETAIAQLLKIQTGFLSKNLAKIKQDHHREITFMLTKLQDYQQNFKLYFLENIRNQSRRDSFANQEDDIRVINKQRSIQNLFQLFSGSLTDEQKKMFAKKGQFFRKQLRIVLLNSLEELINYGTAFIECLKQTIDGSFIHLQKCIIFCAKVHQLLRPFAFEFSNDSPDLQISHFRFYLKRNGTANQNNTKSASYIVGLRCLVPWLTFSNIKKCNPRCIILTSGTLKPLDLWQKQLQLKFQSKLVNSHVIQQEQIKARIITNGPQNCLLNFSYDNMQRNKQKMFKSLIALVVQMAQNIPNGILLIFPSFRLQIEFKFQLHKSPKRQVLWSCKDVFFQEKNIDIDLQKFKQKALSSKGALLAIVCRGKVSQGIDFPDGMCRSVIMVGIPYPNVKDPFIIEKKNHLDNLASRGPNRSSSLRGDQWYTMGTIRTINQALGRVIRHARDYGTVFFIDSRYSELKFRKELPSWITNSLEIIQQVDQYFYKQISSFYERMQIKYDKFIKKEESQSQQIIHKQPQNAFKKMMFQRPIAQREKIQKQKPINWQSKPTNKSKDKSKNSTFDFI